MLNNQRIGAVVSCREADKLKLLLASLSKVDAYQSII